MATEAGVNRIAGKTCQPFPTTEQVAGHRITALCWHEPTSLMLIGTEKGLTIHDAATGQTREMTSADGLAPSSIDAIVSVATSADRRADALHDGARDDAVPDIELVQMRHGGEQRLDVFVVDAVPGVHADAERMRVLRALRQTVEFGGLVGRGNGVGERTGMELDELRAALFGAVDLREIGRDEEADGDPGILQDGHPLHELVEARDGIETALGRELLTFLRHQAAALRTHQRARDAHHLFGQSHFHVEAESRLRKRDHVRVLDVAAVFAKVGGDAVRSGGHAELRGFERRRLGGEPGLTDRRHVVDIDTEFQSSGHIQILLNQKKRKKKSNLVM